MRKEEIKVVKKVWGEELWLVNSDKYCGKLLTINEDAKGSYHSHAIKEETFYVLWGKVFLTVEGKGYILDNSSAPITIEPGDRHSMEGLTSAVIVEISTKHDDEDVFRLEESKA